VNLDEMLTDSRPFLAWLVDWYNGRPALDWTDLLDATQNDPAGAALSAPDQVALSAPDQVALFAVDVTSGFCSEGPLSSDRVGRIADPISRLFQRAYDHGVRHFLLPQDTHSEDALEFASFPPHCVQGTAEPLTVPELSDLPFSQLFHVIEKNSISSSIGTGLDAWLDGHPQVTTFVVTGDCTDICVYHLAMHLRMRANARNLQDVRVILPVDGIDTFDLPVDVASEIGAMPHHADLLHLVFLYSMAQNGIEIISEVL
jgi:nicotinamidase-related amidase